MVETLPIGRRLAFDADKGRLWVVCGSCAKWNLVPFDTRLESIDACERLFRDTRTRYSTDNIGMAKVGNGLTLVRVGRALRPEFASWRYGEQYRKRRRNAVAAAGLGGVAVFAIGVGATAAAGISSAAFASVLMTLGRRGFEHVIGRRARIRTLQPDTDVPLTIGMKSLQEAKLVWTDAASPTLQLPRRPKSPHLEYHRWVEGQLPAMGRRVVGGLNLKAGSTKQIGEAVQHLAREGGDLTRWLRQEATLQHYRSRGILTPPPRGWELESDRQVRISDLKPEHRLALEMWFSEDIERRWLEGELRLLEREWRDAESLAKIADDLVLDDGG